MAHEQRSSVLGKRSEKDSHSNNNNDNGPPTRRQRLSHSKTHYIPINERREAKKKELLPERKSIRSQRESQREKERIEREKARMGGRDLVPLVDKHQELVRQGMDPSLLDERKEESDFLSTMDKTAKPFVTIEEYRDNISYTKSITTSWFPPYKYLIMTSKKITKILKKYNIEVNGNNPIPPPINSFRGMRFPKPIIDGLHNKNIYKPTPIQMQALPVCLSGRDCIGIAYTGSGKTLVFALPMIMFSLEEELSMSLVNGEGPIGIIICPSRELAKQTYDNIIYFTNYLSNSNDNNNNSNNTNNMKYPELRTLLCMGGIDFKIQNNILSNGIHMIVATPGRLKDTLEKKKINFNLLKYWCLDEADRLMDTGFEEDIRDILSFVKNQVQKVFFSATMPPKVRDLAARSMVNPITVNVGRAGAANMDVIQEVEYVKDEAKIVYLLECLKKTGPPVLIFCSNQSDVDDVHEYLLLKGVNAVSIHGGKEQSERISAVNKFKNELCDVLVATDVASKGLDFPDIKHVINFDMPKEIEDYIHRIGRTGRCGNTGVATTFININVPEITLLDLKGLLIEAKQAIPPILVSLGGKYDDSINGIIGCAYCGGLGHRVTDCAKLAAARKGKNMGYVDDKMMLARD